MSKTQRTVTRRDRFREGFDDETGIRRTKVDGKEKTHTPEVDGLVVQFELPTEFTQRQVPAKGDRPALPYQEFRIPITGGYLLINSFLGEEAAGTTVTCRVKVGRKTIGGKGRNSFQVYYLKFTPLEDGDVVSHRLLVAANGQVLEDEVQKSNGDVFAYEFGDLNDHMSGGILIKEP